MRRYGRDSRTRAVHEGMFDEHIVDSVLRSVHIQPTLCLMFSCRICCKTREPSPFLAEELDRQWIGMSSMRQHVNMLGWISDRTSAVCLLVYTSDSTCQHYGRNSKPHVNRGNDTEYSVWINGFQLRMVLSQALRLFTSVKLLAAGPDFHFHLCRKILILPSAFWMPFSSCALLFSKHCSAWSATLCHRLLVDVWHNLTGCNLPYPRPP
jgi:hypothetical protein